MGAFGDKLRREREMRGVTLAEISESTKISTRWLKALEEEQFSYLPGGVFSRGFVRSYARFLGISEEQAVADYVAASNEQPPPEDKFPLEVHEKKRNSPQLNPKRSLTPILLALVALALIGAGWTYWVKNKPSKTSDSAQTHASGRTKAAPPVNASADPVKRSSGAKAAAGSTRGIPSRHAEQETLLVEGGNDDQAGAESKTSGKPFSVIVKANKDSWISIEVDGHTIWQGTLNAHMERSIRTGKELVLKTGNAAGIDVSYNGKPLGALGKEKEVRTLTFNTAGLRQ